MIKITASSDKAKELVRILEKERKKFNRTIKENNMKLMFVVEGDINGLAQKEHCVPDEIINSITNDIQSLVKGYGLESYCDDATDNKGE